MVVVVEGVIVVVIIMIDAGVAGEEGRRGGVLLNSYE